MTGVTIPFRYTQMSGRPIHNSHSNAPARDCRSSLIGTSIAKTGIRGRAAARAIGNTDRALNESRSSCIYGETEDISRTGIGFIVPAIRIKEKYLVGQQRDLNVEIDLPTGKVYMRAIGCRYEKVGIHISAERFFVGAQIVSLSGPDRENYETFLTNGMRSPGSATRAELSIH